MNYLRWLDEVVSEMPCSIFLARIRSSIFCKASRFFKELLSPLITLKSSEVYSSRHSCDLISGSDSNISFEISSISCLNSLILFANRLLFSSRRTLYLFVFVSDHFVHVVVPFVSVRSDGVCIRPLFAFVTDNTADRICIRILLWVATGELVEPIWRTCNDFELFDWFWTLFLCFVKKLSTFCVLVTFK